MNCESINTTSLVRFADMFGDGTDLPASDAEDLFDAIISSDDTGLVRSVLTAWHRKGYSGHELAALAQVMRTRCVPVRSGHDVFVDTVGTGGSTAKTFNVSTAAAFVIAGAGVPVAKHGNRAATSRSGSADVLSELGVNPAVDAATAERCLNEIGICFMFAPNFHRLSPTLATVRRELGFPTIFNKLGPLCNPARAPHQIVGIADSGDLENAASALARLGTRRSWVVNGSDGLDEITLSGATRVIEIRGNKLSEFELRPGDFGLETRDIGPLAVRTSAESARVIKGILSGSTNGAARELVVMNAAAAFFVAGQQASLVDAAAAASESIESGAAMMKLEQLAAATR